MSNNTATSWIPGASDFLGYGVNVFGNYFKPDLKDKFLDFTPYDLPTAQWSDQLIPGTTNTFKLPSTIAYSNISSAHGETIVAESKMKMSEELSVRANAKGTYGAFSATVKASYKNFNDTEEDRWYCLTDGSQKVYSLLASNLDPTLIHKQVQKKDIYVNLLKVLNANQPCNAQTEETYFGFFDWYGTHVITSVQMGGGLHIFTSLEKTYAKTAQEVETSATVEYTGVFEGGGGADWKKKVETWLSSRKGSIDAYGGDSGSPLLAKVMSGVLPTTDLSADLTTWAASVPKNPTMVNFKLTKIGDLFETNNQRMLVNEAFDRYAQSYLCLSYANRQSRLEWRGELVATQPLTKAHIGPNTTVERGAPRFQGWCVINRTTGAVDSVIPFPQNTPEQSVPAELKDPKKYNNNNYVLLFMHWEGTGTSYQSRWTEAPFNPEVADFLRRCGGGKVLQDYNNMSRTQPGFYYFMGYYVLCGVIGAGPGRGKEFTNIYVKPPGAPYDDIIIPLIPQQTGAGFRLSLLDLG